MNLASLVVALFVSTLLPTSPLPQTQTGDDSRGDAQRNLIQLEHAWGDAIVHRDSATLEEILADDYTLTTPDGQVVSRSQEIENVLAPADGSVAITDVDVEDVGVRVFGETAVVSSRFTLTVSAEGRPVETPFRHTDVFVRDHDHWRCVARQATRIVEEDSASN